MSASRDASEMVRRIWSALWGGQFIFADDNTHVSEMFGVEGSLSSHSWSRGIPRLRRRGPSSGNTTCFSSDAIAAGPTAVKRRCLWTRIEWDPVSTEDEDRRRTGTGESGARMLWGSDGGDDSHDAGYELDGVYWAVCASSNVSSESSMLSTSVLGGGAVLDRCGWTGAAGGPSTLSGGGTEPSLDAISSPSLSWSCIVDGTRGG